MWLFGLGFFSQHKTVAALPASKFHLHYYLPREKAKKGKKKEAVDALVPADLKVAPVLPAPADSPDPEVLLKDFIEAKSDDKKKVLLVAGMNALFTISDHIRKNKKHIAGVIVFDNPSNLYDYSITIADGERIKEGQWWKKKGFLENDIVRFLREMDKAEPFKIKKLKKIRRKLMSNPEERPSIKDEKEAKANRPRGFLRTFIETVSGVMGTNPKRDAILKSFMGYVVGAEKRRSMKNATAYYVKKGGDEKTVKELKKFMATAKGKDLFATFYHLAKGQSFRALQAKYKTLDMDDWLVLGEWVPPTEKHKFYERPGR